MRLELPDSNWAELRPAEDLYDADRRAVLKTLTFKLDENRTRTYSGDTDDAMSDAMLRMVIENWSYTHLPIPAKDPTSIGKLRISHARALREGIADHMKVVYGQDGDENPTLSASSNSSSQAGPSSVS